MSDPLGLLGNSLSVNRQAPLPQRAGVGAAPDHGSGFKEMLQQQIDQLNQLQNDANRAMEDLATGRRDDLEGVIMATQKADVAFKMLLQVRNKVMDAYDEVKQLRI